MTLQRMDNVLIVVDDLEAARAFFTELGMELEGETQVEGPWVDRTVGLDGVRADIAMMRTPDGHGRVELRETADLLGILPPLPSTPFTTREFAALSRCGTLLAQRTVYCLRATGIIEPAGRRGRVPLHARAG